MEIREASSSRDISQLIEEYRAIKRPTKPAKATTAALKKEPVMSTHKPPLSLDTPIAIDGPGDTQSYRAVWQMAADAWDNSPAIQAAHANRFTYIARMIADAEARGRAARGPKVQKFTNPKEIR